VITIGANSQILVSLTQEGNHILKQSYDEANESYKKQTGHYPEPVFFPKTDLGTGYFKMTLWELVEMFGAHTHIGGDTLYSIKVPEATDAHR
jgi:hypothetical protein